MNEESLPQATREARMVGAPMLRSRIVIALTWSCAGVLCSLQCLAREADSVPLLVDRYAQDCAVHLILPAKWTLKTEHRDGACVVTADEPAHASRCGSVADDKAYCHPDHRIEISVRPGSIQALTTSDASDNSPFEFRDAQWLLHDDWKENRAEHLRQTPRMVLVADYATRDYYDDGTYCCVGRNWWALADLPAHRVARIQVGWDAISWDDDTSSWDEGTDEQARNNVERFLRALK